MAAPTTKLWQETASKVLNQLTPAEKATIGAITTRQQLETYLRTLQGSFPSLSTKKNDSRFGKITEQIQPISIAIDILAQGNGMPSTLLWGVFGLTVELTADRDQVFEPVITAFEDLLKTMPSFSDIASVLSEHESLQMAIADVYSEYLQLGIRCVKWFGRNSSGLNFITRIKWQREQNLLEKEIRCIKGLVDEVYKQTKTATDMEMLKQGRDRHQEMLARQDELLTAVKASPQHQAQTQTLASPKFNLPYLATKSFCGRDLELDELHSRLWPTPPLSKRSLTTAALLGLGGIGKSQLALRYAYAHKDLYKAQFWIACDTPVKISQGISEIAKILGHGDLGPAQSLASVKNWLNSTDEEWLLILDNAEDPYLLSDLWPSSNKGSIIITSQNSLWRMQDSVDATLRVESLDVDPSIALLRNTMAKQGRSVSDDDASAIVGEVGRLPLAIRQIGSYIATEDIDPLDFLQLYRDRQVALDIGSWEDSRTPLYFHTLATVWEFAFSKLCPDAAFMIGAMSLLDPDNIPDIFFKNRMAGGDQQASTLDDIAHQLPPNSDTIYGLGSLTKAMTAAAVGVLVEDGKLNWSTPVKSILPKLSQKNPRVEDLVNIADLLSHRTGLSDAVPLSYTFQGDGDFILPKTQLYPVFESLPTSTSIRTGWQYLNSGYAIAGKIVETLSGDSFRDYLNATIFNKLGMSSTTLRPSDVFEPSSIALPYASLANGTPFALPNRQIFENTFMEPAGGVYSSVNDMLKWCQSLLNNLDCESSANASLPNIDFIMSNQVPIDNPSLLERSYGLGWVRTQLPGSIGLIGDNMDILSEQEVPAFHVGQQSKLLIYHQGSTVGYYGCLLIFPETKSAVVTLTNTAALNDVADWIARAYAETLFGKEKPTDYIGLATTSKDRLVELYQDLQRDVNDGRRPNTKPKSLAPFVGTYDHPTLPFNIEIVRDSSDLALLFQGKETHRYSLRHFRDDTFEWTLTRDETALRGRYDVWDPSYFQFNFTARGASDHFGELHWSITHDQPEVFTRRSDR